SSAILKETPAPLPKKPLPELNAVIVRCLEKQPERRYQRAGELFAALQAIQTAAKPQVVSGKVHRRGLVAAIAVFFAVTVLGVGWWTNSKEPVPEPRIDSLVVLPLDNLTGNPDQEYFVAGMHAGLIAELGQISARRVISRTSAMSYKGTTKSAPEIARDLKVNGVLEGSIFRDAEDVHFQVQLIRAAPVERQIWSKTYS